jgi:hypothetical protein
VARVHTETTPGGDGLLAGEAVIALEADDGARHEARLALPPGAPGRPPSDEELRAKVADCARDLAGDVLALRWDTAAGLLREQLG